MIVRQDGQPIAFAGLWESFRWPDETVTRSFTILTTTPNAEMSELHDRMPVILDRQDWPVWLGETGRPARRLAAEQRTGVAGNVGGGNCPRRL